MAGFVASRNEIGMRRFGEPVTVANHPKAKLMYYFNSVACVLELDNMGRFTKHQNYLDLDEEDTDTLLRLVILFSPDELIDKVFFHSDRLCDDRTNKFFELSSVTNLLAVTGTILVGGQQKRVAKIMTFKRVWMENYYLNPIRTYQYRLSRLARGLPGYEPPRNLSSASPRYEPPRNLSSASPRYERPRNSSSASKCCTLL